MQPQLEETIVALATAGGSGARAIVRMSGPLTRTLLAAVQAKPAELRRNTLTPVELRVSGLNHPLPAEVLFAEAPASYTGQDTGEIHLISSPPVVDALTADLLNAGARTAQPGEYTLRAFLAGKRDLTQSEAVLAVIEANSRDELEEALLQLAGGMAQPLQQQRDDLLNLLADVEAGLDFTDEHIEFVSKEEMLRRVGKALAHFIDLQRKLETRSLSGRTVRFVLAGEPNAGKSSLFNALAGLPLAIVSPKAGTTRDYLRRTISLGNANIEIVDTAGVQGETADAIEAKAQALREAQMQQADGIVWCVAADRLPEGHPPPAELGSPERVLTVVTKCDLAPPPNGTLGTSATQKLNLDRLKGELERRAELLLRPALAPSLSRCRQHIAGVLAHLRQAHEVILFDDGPELVAFEVRAALDDLGEMVGAIYTDDLLDRIFSRFCIGK